MNNLQPITREEMFLADIAEASQGGGGVSGLPAVTSDDNGDVLTVVSGAWAKAQPSGGAVIMFDSTGCLTPYANVLSMLNSGIMPSVAYFESDIVSSVYMGTSFGINVVTGVITVEAKYENYEDGDDAYVSVNVVHIDINSDDTSEVTYGAYYFSVTDDN